MLKVYYSTDFLSDAPIGSYRLKRMKKCRNDEDKLYLAMAERLLIHALKENGFEEKLPLNIDRNAKPFLLSHAADFSISHTKGMSLAAISNRVVGADCERVREINDISKLFLCDKEKELLRDARNFNNKLFTLWTIKESYVKAFGIGIQNMKNCEIEGDRIQAEGFPSLMYSTHVFKDFVLSAVGDEKAEFIKV